MDSDHTVADRLVGDARRKTAKNESPGLGNIALRRPVPTKQARLGIILGSVAILVGVFFSTPALALG